MAKIFISYSHKDEKWKDWLQSHLSVLEKQGKLDIWDDRQIELGSDWLPDIEQSLNDSHIAILLITRHFLTSDFILGKEIPVFLERRASDGLRVFPVIISPCAWQAIDWLSTMQGFPKDNQHLAGRGDHEVDEQFALLANKINDLLKKSSVARMQPAECGEQTTKPKPPTPSENNLHSASSIQTTKPLPHTSRTKLFGRTKELSILTRAWNGDKYNVVVLKAMGGTGKTALLKTWLDRFNDKGLHADKIYTWSFYSQGSAEDKQASADDFFNKALNFFGYQGDPIASAHDKGIKLAELINQQRTLLVLDGLEPLQYPVGTMHGYLKDKGLQALLRQLAAHNQGLCLISSRQTIVELDDKPLVLSHDLGQLQTIDGIALLKSYGVTGAEEELEKAVEEVAGHALALNLLGNYVNTVLQGDIRKRDTIPALSKEREEGKHAEKVMAAYETHLKGTIALSILYMMGLFDRPVSSAAIKYLRDAKIPQLTDQLGDEADWQYALDDLRQQQLLNKAITGSDALASQAHHTGEAKASHPLAGDTLDTHPLIREYFGKQLKQSHPSVWQQAHRLLYDYYKDLPEKHQPDTLEEMDPLFAAIAHGCAAGMYQQALVDVYWPRIRREGEMYIGKKLGAFGAELFAPSHFFSQHWHTPATELTDDDKAVMFNFAAFNLRALGRLQEAVEPMQASVEMYLEQDNWKHAAMCASSLSELQLTRGAVANAITAAQRSVEFADKSGDAFTRMLSRTTLADAQHQIGELAKAQELFEKAESLQKERQAEYPQLYSLPGFRYCDLLLTAGQWQEVQQRAEQTYEYRDMDGYSLLDIALDQLSLGRVSLQQAISQTKNTSSNVGRISATPSAKLSHDTQVLAPFTDTLTADDASLSTLQTAKNWLNQAVDGLRKAGQEDYLPHSLLARACYHRFCLAFTTDVARVDVGNTGKPTTDPMFRTLNTGYADECEIPKGENAKKLALADLQETHDIAQRGGILLHLCDYHLESARLALTIDQPVFELTASEHTQKAKQLIDDTGYKHRLPEVEYLEALL